GAGSDVAVAARGERVGAALRRGGAADVFFGSGISAGFELVAGRARGDPRGVRPLRDPVFDPVAGGGAAGEVVADRGAGGGGSRGDDSLCGVCSTTSCAARNERADRGDFGEVLADGFVGVSVESSAGSGDRIVQWVDAPDPDLGAAGAR